MESNQTSIDWLIERLQAPCRGIPQHIIDQAKEMHKEEILKAHTRGIIEMYGFPKKHLSQDYYDQTYGRSEE